MVFFVEPKSTNPEWEHLKYQILVKGAFTGCLHMLSSSLMFTGEQKSNKTAQLPECACMLENQFLQEFKKGRDGRGSKRKTRRRWILPVRDDGDPTGVEGFEGKLLLVWSGE